MYVGKIPDSKEKVALDEATLTARSRPIRPLFPKGYRHDVQIMNIVLVLIQIAHQKWQQ